MTESVKFTIEGDATKAIRELLKTAKAQGELIRQLKDTAKAARSAESAASKTSKTLSGMGRSFKTGLGSLLGGISVAAAIRTVGEGFEKATANAMAFEDEMTGLLSLGDNLKNIDGMKTAVLQMSNAFGISRREVADAMFNIQSSAGNLSKEIQSDLLRNAMQLSKVTGTALPISVNGLTKSFQIYRDEVSSVAEMQGRLFMTAERGALTFEDLATLFPDVANAAKTMGFRLNEVLGALSTATRVGGRNERTFTGIRNVFLRMNKAIEEGVVKQGSFVDMIQQLASVDPKVLAKIFGAEAIGAVASLTQQVRVLREEIAMVGASGAGLVAAKEALRYSDSGYGVSRQIESLRKTGENITANPEYMRRHGKALSEYETRKLYLKSELPFWLTDTMAGNAITSIAASSQTALASQKDKWWMWASPATRYAAQVAGNQMGSARGRAVELGAMDDVTAMDKSLRENMPGLAEQQYQHYLQGILAATQKTADATRSGAYKPPALRD